MKKINASYIDKVMWLHLQDLSLQVPTSEGSVIRGFLKTPEEFFLTPGHTFSEMLSVESSILRKFPNLKEFTIPDV